MCQWQIAARCENEFGACVHEHSCCSVETAILSTSLQYPSVLQNREPKWENPMSPYKSRLFTGNHPKCLENTGFRGSVLIPRKMVNSVVYAISLKTQNQVPQGVPVRVRPPAPKKRQASQKLGAFYLFTINSSLKSSGAKGCGSSRFFIVRMHFYSSQCLTKGKICILIHPANIIFASVTTG